MITLAYHKIDDRFEWGLTSTPPKQFARQMEVLAAANTCSITFDDSFKTILDNAIPVLDEHNLRSTIFVVTGSVGTANTWDVNFFWRKFEHLNWTDLRELAAQGHTIGSHTVSHRDLTLLTGREVRGELERSKKALEDGLGRPVDQVSYPFGKTDDRVSRIARELGYVKGYTMRGASRDNMSIRRRGVYRFDTLASFKRKISGPEYNIEDLKGAVINWFSQGTPLLRQVMLQH